MWGKKAGQTADQLSRSGNQILCFGKHFSHIYVGRQSKRFCSVAIHVGTTVVVVETFFGRQKMDQLSKIDRKENTRARASWIRASFYSFDFHRVI